MGQHVFPTDFNVLLAEFTELLDDVFIFSIEEQALVPLLLIPGPGIMDLLHEI